MDEALCCGGPEHPCGVRGTRLSESHRAKAPVPVISILYRILYRPVLDFSGMKRFPVWEFLFFFVFPEVVGT